MVEISGTNVPARVHDFFSGYGAHPAGPWFASSQEHLSVLDPATEEVVGVIPTTSLDDLDRSVAAARAAFDTGPWPRMRPRDRSRWMTKLADEVAAHADLLADIATLEIGNPRAQSQEMHGTSPADFFAWWARAAESGPSDGWEEDLGPHSGVVDSTSVLYREPVGVVAAMAAYNMPLLIASFKLGGAMAAGCTNVFLPSPRTPLHAIALMKLAQGIDFPEGVINLVIGSPDIGRALTESRSVDLVTFTGSAAVGKMIMRQASSDVKRVVLELGGKSPDIILPGASLAQVMTPSLARLTRNAGQMCGATTRTFVPVELYDEYVEAVQKGVSNIAVGDPWKSETDMGPLIRAEHRTSVEAMVDRALDAGAHVVAGGGRPEMNRGFYVNPTVLGGAGINSEIAQEEVFGPVSVIFPYADVDEAVELANNSRYGLNANVWGETSRATEVARRLRAGTVTVNGGGGVRSDVPWPSVGESGIGVDRGMDGFREFLNLRHVQVRSATPRREQ